MLSLTNTFRLTARRQPCRIPAPRAMSFQPAKTPVVGVDTMEQFTDYMNTVAEEQEAIPSEDVIYDAGTVEPASSVPLHAKGFPKLKGFHPDRFVQPKNFTREGYNQMAHRGYTKRPLLGPDAPTSRYLDVLHQMNIDPLHECQNSRIMSHYVTAMGKIKGRAETNLTWRTQRRVGKAIRRAKMMGIIPVLSRRALLSDHK
ncbi:hypothetical protein C8Q79DRAFT_900880 [Trametes meyenii]|nr:hypothetical protein C8Q79DRAFT_900880 [Trametes meyenii]